MPHLHGTASDGEYLISHGLQTLVVIYILGLDSEPMALTNAEVRFLPRRLPQPQVHNVFQ